MKSFKNWIIESILREVFNLRETKFNFWPDKLLGKEPREVPTDLLNWVLKKIDDPRKVSPAFRREIEAELERRAGGGRAVPQPQGRPQAQPAAPAARKWYFAQVIGPNSLNIPQGAYVAVAKRGDQDYDTVSLTTRHSGILPSQGIQGMIVSIKDGDQQVVGANPEELKKRIPQATKADRKEPHQHLIPEDKISDEQKKIDARFEKLLHSPGKSHMMISALAGTGKTTMLEHLAYKYGKPGQKWLYLVFNSKNSVEAQEKFGELNFVTVATTNSFLGKLLGSRENKAKFQQTQRIAQAIENRPGEKKKKPEKISLIADGNQFMSVMSGLGIPKEATCPDCHGPVKKIATCPMCDRKLSDGEATAKECRQCRRDFRRAKQSAWCDSCRGNPFGSVGGTVMSLVGAIQKEFKQITTKLANLAKSFAVDARNRSQIKERIDYIVKDYRLDTSLSDVKERINNYSGSYKTNTIAHLSAMLGYDFMEKDFDKEIQEAADWLLRETMPGATDQVHMHGRNEHKLGELRDFNDDLWYAAVHADELHWPKFDIVLADEVQDFNECQKIVLQKLSEQGAKIVAVGDANQSIYRFRGADADAFSNLGKSLTEWSDDKQNVVQHLTKNFRSRPEVLDQATEETHVKDLVSGRKWGGTGNVTKFEKNYDELFQDLEKEHQEGKLQQTAFLSRTTEPLVHAALKLMADGVPFQILGKDIAGDLAEHINMMTGRFGIQDHDHCDKLQEKMEEHLEKEVDKYETQMQKAAYLQGLKETTDALLRSIEQFQSANTRGRGTVGEFKDWIRDRMGGLDIEQNEEDYKEYRRKMEEENPVILTTVHKAKGLEWSRTYILRYDLFPHPKSVGNEKEEAQEQNAKYVGLTRAKNEQHIVTLKGQPGYKDE